MNLDFDTTNFRFNSRAAALIFNKDKTKILLYKVDDGRDFYLLPGGRIEEFEDSKEAIKREIYEELGYKLEFEICCIQENFLKKDNKNIMQYCFCYKTIYNEELKETIIKCKDRENQYFYWVDLKDLPKYKLYPESVNKLIDSEEVKHFIEKVDI